MNREPADSAKIAAIRTLLEQLEPNVSFVVPAQALGKLFVVLPKSGASAVQARVIVLEFAEAFGDAGTERRTLLSATDLVFDHKLQFWDALIVTAAADERCTILLSEDMEHGFVKRGLTVINPLARPIHPKLAAATGCRPNICK